MPTRKFDPDVLRREMDAQRDAFRDAARSELQRLGDARTRLQAVWQDERDEDLLFELQRRAHKLAGRGGTFGFPQVSDTARALEIEMGRIIGSDMPIGAQDMETLSEMIEGVGNAVNAMS